MTPEEKAKELTNNFINNVIWQLEDDTTTFLILHEAKQCALICVDEILETINNSITFVDENGNYISELPNRQYWQEVKKEIEKI